MTRYPIRQRVSIFCPGCNRMVPQDRSVYPDVVVLWVLYIIADRILQSDRRSI